MCLLSFTDKEICLSDQEQSIQMGFGTPKHFLYYLGYRKNLLGLLELNDNLLTNLCWYIPY